MLLVHGLLSSPVTWAPMFNDLQADPVLRERFQFWVYFYPTGNPYLATAADLRQNLDAIRADLDPQHQDPALDQMVLVGHSMGGLVSQLLTVDGGDDFWKLVSDEPIQQVKAEEHGQGGAGGDVLLPAADGREAGGLPGHAAPRVAAEPVAAGPAGPAVHPGAEGLDGRGDRPDGRESRR